MTITRIWQMVATAWDDATQAFKVKLATASDVDIGDVDVLTEPATVANGGSLPAVVKAVAGYDGANVRAIKTDASGEPQVDVLTEPATVANGGNLPAVIKAVAGYDGANVRAIKTDASGEPQVDVLTLPALEATTVTEYNVTLTSANTEYGQTLPANTRKVLFRCRSGAVIRYAWAAGHVAGPTPPYQTLAAGAEYVLEGVKLASSALYFASATAGVVVELEAWT